MTKTNEEVQGSVTRYWRYPHNNMTVDEYREYRRASLEEKRKNWGLSMADAITAVDAQSLEEYAKSLEYAAREVSYGVYDVFNRETLGEQICLLHDRLKLITAVLDRIEESID